MIRSAGRASARALSPARHDTLFRPFHHTTINHMHIYPHLASQPPHLLGPHTTLHPIGIAHTHSYIIYTQILLLPLRVAATGRVPADAVAQPSKAITDWVGYV